MTRLQTEQVKVRRQGDHPEQLLGRGRLYVVHAVLSRVQD